ncbi:MAG: outer membrane beta-barrel protein [Myxococcales bacterium]|nr:outer membrane beta-barrel protein [Myxococcales bacterium]
MRLRFNRYCFLLIALLASGVVLSGTTTARAQAWLDDRDRTEGAGIRTGNLEIHPGLGAEVGYDSNVYNQSSGAQGSAILRITPHISLSTLGSERSGEDQGEHVAPRLSFRAGLSGSLYHYFATTQKTNVGIGADLALTINPEGRFAFGITDIYTRSIRPFAAGPASFNYARDQNNAGVNLRFGTAGRIFEGNIGYTAQLDLFEDSFLSYANGLTHQIDLGATWRFLPHTALVYDFQLNNASYFDTSGSTGLALSTNTRLRTRLGLNGAFTPKFSMTLMVGYGAAFVQDASFAEKETVVGQLELRFRPSPTNTFKLGYNRELEASILGAWRVRDRGYLNYQMVFGRALMLGVEGSAAYVSYGTTSSVSTSATRSDVVLTAKLFGEYRFTDWLALNATVMYTGDITSFQYNIPGLVTDAADYQKVEAWLGLRVFY